MRKIIDYQIIASKIAEELQPEVIKQIKLGWQPLGSISTIMVPQRINSNYTTNTRHLCQAMVKYEEK